MYEWNPVFNLVMKIKRDYYLEKEYSDTYNFEQWVDYLYNKDYNNTFNSLLYIEDKYRYLEQLDCLQFTQYGNYLLIRYGIAELQKDFWTNANSIYRECRSIVIELNKEELVLTPFRKFYNLNEIEENSIENIKKEITESKNIEFTNKLDGSMQSARFYNDEIFMAGSKSLDKNESWRLDDGYNKLTENHIRMIKENPQYTFIFEYISLKDAHIVFYKKEQEGLYLLSARNVYTGKELTYTEIKEYSLKYNVTMAQMENKTLENIIDEGKLIKADKKEGWVLLIENIDNTIHRVKFKCDDYIHLHRLLDKISSINVIIQNIADDKYDDMLSKIPDSYKNRVQQIANKIFEYKHNTECKINKVYNLSPKDDKKTFMIWVDTNIEKEINGYVKCKYLDKEYNVLTKGSPNAKTYKKLKDMGVYSDYSALFADLEE